MAGQQGSGPAADHGARKRAHGRQLESRGEWPGPGCAQRRSRDSGRRGRRAGADARTERSEGAQVPDAECPKSGPESRRNERPGPQAAKYRTGTGRACAGRGVGPPSFRHSDRGAPERGGNGPAGAPAGCYAALTELPDSGRQSSAHTRSMCVCAATDEGSEPASGLRFSAKARRGER